MAFSTIYYLRVRGVIGVVLACLKSKTTRSALLSGSMDPISFSSLKALAPFIVAISNTFSAVRFLSEAFLLRIFPYA
ncbi:MAG: hypothetical protein QXG01_06820, partial [Candidatus Bathyarchaeia archaeon]